MRSQQDCYSVPNGTLYHECNIALGTSWPSTASVEPRLTWAQTGLREQ